MKEKKKGTLFFLNRWARNRNPSRSFSLRLLKMPALHFCPHLTRESKSWCYMNVL